MTPAQRCTDRLAKPAARLFASSVLLAMLATSASAAIQPDGSAASLRTRYAEMRSEIEHGTFDQALRLESRERSDALAGEIHAVVDYPFATVRTALREAGKWCEILILHPNVEHCRVNGGKPNGDASIDVDLGRALLPLTVSYRVGDEAADYLQLKLAADAGPLGTTDYRIELEAAPLDERRTIMHLTFSHGYGTRARLAMKTYLATLARSKVGFTVVEQDRDGRPRYVRDLRGALERNAMRYYLAIEAYLASLSAAPPEQRELRLATWYSYTQRYAIQLREDADYLVNKRAQLARQPAAS